MTLKDELLFQWEHYSNEYKRKPTKSCLKTIQSLEREMAVETNKENNK